MNAAARIAPATRLELFKEIPSTEPPHVFRMPDKPVTFGQIVMSLAFILGLLFFPGLNEPRWANWWHPLNLALLCAALAAGSWLAKALVMAWTRQRLEVDVDLECLSVVVMRPFKVRRTELRFDRMSRIRVLEGSAWGSLVQEGFGVHVETADGGILDLGFGSQDEARKLAGRISRLTGAPVEEAGATAAGGRRREGSRARRR